MIYDRECFCSKEQGTHHFNILDFYPQFGKRNSSGCFQLVTYEDFMSSTWANATWFVQCTIKASVFRPIRHRPTGSRDYILSQLECDQKAKLQNVAQYIQLLCTKQVSRINEKQPSQVKCLNDVVKSMYSMVQEQDMPDTVIAVLSTSLCAIDANKRLLLRSEQIVLQSCSTCDSRPRCVR